MPSAARVLAVHLRSGCCRQRDAGAAAGAKGTSRLITRLLRATGGGTCRTDACRIGLVPGGVFVPFIALQFRRTRLNHAEVRPLRAPGKGRNLLTFDKLFLKLKTFAAAGSEGRHQGPDKDEALRARFPGALERLADPWARALSVPSRICSHAERDLEARAGTAGQPIVTPECLQASGS